MGCSRFSRMILVGAVSTALFGCDLRGEIEATTGSSPKVEPPPVKRDAPPLKPFPAAPAAGSAAPPSGAPMSFADLADRANPGVVFVRVAVPGRRGLRGDVMNVGSGSGFVFSPEGLILTNHHVVAGAAEIQVELADHRKFRAQLVGADPLTDLAVLRVDAKDLSVLPLGDSDQVRVGDWAVAIGNPFGLTHTVSAGIISAKERGTKDVELDNPQAYYSFLQTDASINPGNSGGPLLDLSGRVIGINTAIRAEANSIGFAIPVNMVRELLPRLLRDGRVVRAVLGIHVADVFELPNPPPDLKGALIAGVLHGSPAEKAGLEPGDVVVRLGEHETESPERLRWWASLAEPGKPLRVEFFRGKERKSLEIAPVVATSY